MVHKVCVIVCPHCGFEKPMLEKKSRGLVIFQCKKCSARILTESHQECFVFRELEKNHAVR